MQYSHIGKAMIEITSISGGSLLVNHISNSLAKIPAPEIAAIDRALNFIFPPGENPTSNVENLIRIRRAAILISRTINEKLPPRLPIGSVPYGPQSWNYKFLLEYVEKYIAHVRDRTVTGAPGIYLAGSFWTYSTEAERSRAMAAYTEAIELCTFGLVAAHHAGHRPAIGAPRAPGFDIYSGILSMWFGDARNALEVVKSNLKLTLAGLRSSYIRLSYGGKNIQAGVKLKESGFEAPEVREVSVQRSSAGHVWPTNRNMITLDEDFFDWEKTKDRLDSEIVASEPKEYRFSRGGIFLHEATHLYASTVDVTVSDDIYMRFGLTPPPEGKKRARGYGPTTCLALARTDPAAAITNADSYRIFCETAKYYRQRAGR